MFKKAALGLTVFLLLVLVGCEWNFGKGVQKDLLSGLQVTNDGLVYESAYLTVNDQETTENVFDLGTEVFMNFDGVDYFEEVDGKVFPGAAMVVYDADGQELFSEDDLFAQYSESGVTPEEASAMFVSLLIGDPLVSGEQYTWKARIWDKVGGGHIDAELGLGVI
ncbi:MAG: hypothetical protein WC570_01880 [Patescibacteria group bacterium]